MIEPLVQQLNPLSCPPPLEECIHADSGDRGNQFAVVHIEGVNVQRAREYMLIVDATDRRGTNRLRRIHLDVNRTGNSGCSFLIDFGIHLKGPLGTLYFGTHLHSTPLHRLM
jgi:hypothetical protein